MKVTTQFPVIAETVLEVTCSDSKGITIGSTEITCVTDLKFTYLEEPWCLGKLITFYFATD